ncbi:endoribonuclease LACTB2-like isoform X1 [Liolophura sinensis]|uniref:endoribonuclease LACTB2-like isoform X1 n=1 Tax=Liolophura sinensis TaxID=3198878 RepID=UPI0031588C23
MQPRSNDASGNKHICHWRILIDAGEPGKPEYTSLLKTELSQRNVVLSDIFITHWHFDHVGGVPDVCREVTTDVPNIWKYKRVSQSDVDLGGELRYDFVDDNKILRTDGATLRAVHTPGHTEDHMILYLEEENAVFSGDCILGEGTTVFEDLYTYMKSLETILSLQPRVIYPGHGPVIENPIEVIQQYISHRQMREGQILGTLKERAGQSLTAMELVKIIYKDVPERLHLPAEKNVNNHLVKLKKENKIDWDVKDGEKRWRIVIKSNV